MDKHDNFRNLILALGCFIGGMTIGFGIATIILF